MTKLRIFAFDTSCACRFFSGPVHAGGVKGYGAPFGNIVRKLLIPAIQSKHSRKLQHNPGVSEKFETVTDLQTASYVEYSLDLTHHHPRHDSPSASEDPDEESSK